MPGEVIILCFTGRLLGEQSTGSEFFAAILQYTNNGVNVDDEDTIGSKA